MSENEFDFSGLEVQQQKVTGPDGKDYLLVEASGDSAVRFNNARAACVRLENGKVAGVGKTGSLEPLLVSLCLFETTLTGDPGKVVPEGRIRQWPSKVQTKLYAKALEISELNEDADDIDKLIEERDKLNERIDSLQEDPAGNVQSSTEDGLS